MSKDMYINGVKVKSVTLDGTPVKAIGDGVTTLWQYTDSKNYFYFEDLSGSSNSVTLTKTGSAEEWVSLEYSTDKSTWTPLVMGTAVPLAANGKVYFRGNNANLSTGSANTHTFSSTGSVHAGGDAVSLLDKTCAYKTVTTAYAFGYLFSGMTTLYSVDSALFDNLTVSTGLNTFNNTFNGCTALTNAPAFAHVTGVTTGTFRETFAGCSSLASAPTLNISTVAGGSNNSFRSMFYQCTSLTSAANISITASAATENCFYQMFMGCTRLATAPSVSIAAFSGNTQCTKMFHGCTALTNISGISITASSVNTQTLKEMFRGCTALTTAPDLSSITTLGDNSLNCMFYGCSSLQSITVGFTEWGDESDSTASNYQATRNWTYGCNYASGVFNCPSALPQTRNSSDNTTSAHYIPYSWSVVNPSSVNYLGYIHRSTLAAGGLDYMIGTGIYPTVDTEIRYKAQYKGFQNGYTWVGTEGAPDSNDFRFFYYNSYYFDVGGNRIGKSVYLSSGNLVDMTLSDYKIHDNRAGSDIASGSTYSSVPTSYEIKFDVGSLWVNGIEIRQGGVLVFDGVAAEVNGEYGLYDSVTQTLFTNANYGIVGEPAEMKAPTISKDQNSIKIYRNSFGGDIYYTTDGTEPTSSSTPYTQPLAAVVGQTIKAVVSDGTTTSTVASYTVTASTLSSPNISRDGNYVKITQSNDSYKQAVIKYTTDGSTPDANSQTYSSRFAAVYNQTIKAICISAYDTDLYPNSGVSTHVVSAYTLTAPVISRSENNVVITQSNDSYKQAVIKYTTDGSAPDASSATYSSAFAAVLGQTVKAVCVSGYDTALYPDSSVTEFTVVTQKISAPKIKFDANGNCTIENTAPSYMGGTVRYTTDGSTPTSSSTAYTSQFTVQLNDTVKAAAFSDNALYTDSDVSSKTYEGAVIFDPLTINNTSNETGTFYVGKYGSPSSSNLEYSLDGGTTWTNYDMTNRPNVSVPAGTSIMLRGSNPTGFNRGTVYNNTWRLRFNKTFTVYGSLFSLRNTDPAVFSAIDTTLDGEFMALFQENRQLTDASGLETSVIVEAATWSMWSLFQYCTSLTGAPDFSSLETIGNSGINMMFEGCSALRVGTNLLNVTSVTDYSFRSLYYGCSSLTTAWSPSVNPWNNRACDMWINTGTPSTGTLYKRPGITPGGVNSRWTIIEV